MKRILIAAVLLSAPSLPAFAATSSDMSCSHFTAMNSAGQMATVDSMRSSMSEANKMPSSNEMVSKVAADCKGHPNMMVHEAMKNAIPH
jgi:hypothetical protein